MPIDHRDWDFLCCRDTPSSWIHVQRWRRSAPLRRAPIGRLSQYLVGSRANTWHLLVTDDFSLMPVTHEYRNALLSFFVLEQDCGWRYSGLRGLRVAPRILRTRHFSASMLHTLQHVGLWTRASHVRTKRRLLAVGSAPTAQWQRVGTLVGSTAAHRPARWGGVWAALKDCLAFGTYFSAGVTLTEPPRRRNRPAALRAVHCVTEEQPHLVA